MFSPIAYKLGKTMTTNYFKPKNGERLICYGSAMGYNFALIYVFSKTLKYMLDNDQNDNIYK
jgi:hypothetical protein